MRNLKFLFLAVILTCFVGVIPANAKAYVIRGSEDKPLTYEIDGEQYRATAHVEYQFVNTPNLNLNWVSHGYLTKVEKWDGQVWVELDDIPSPKKTVKAIDPRGFDEKVTINPRGKVTVSAHVKDVNPWWL